ncbi:MAG: octaprenyl diphosphate synthase [Phycisphaerae bacterium]|nr:MAG: octaprenyl diphosphate synthase [Phycisphaerae bacterium]
MATLVHDDVLDEADTRRLGQTVNSLHGNEAAVMLGDLLLAAAYEQCSLLPDKEPSLLIARASVVMCGGELLQLHHRADWSLDEPTYFEIINRKTGELIAASATMGALLVGAAPEHRDALAAFARDVGAAFQIQDDLLDLRGDERVVGKSLGRDLQKGKLTLPIIHHLAAASPIIRGRSLRLLDDAHGCKSAQQLTGITRELLHAIYQTESVRHAASEASALVHRAVQRLDQIPESPAREALRRLAEAVIDRDY